MISSTPAFEGAQTRRRGFGPPALTIQFSKKAAMMPRTLERGKESNERADKQLAGKLTDLLRVVLPRHI